MKARASLAAFLLATVGCAAELEPTPDAPLPDCVAVCKVGEDAMWWLCRADGSCACTSSPHLACEDRT